MDDDIVEPKGFDALRPKTHIRIVDRPSDHELKAMHNHARANSTQAQCTITVHNIDKIFSVDKVFELDEIFNVELILIALNPDRYNLKYFGDGLRFAGFIINDTDRKRVTGSFTGIKGGSFTILLDK